MWRNQTSTLVELYVFFVCVGFFHRLKSFILIPAICRVAASSVVVSVLNIFVLCSSRSWVSELLSGT